METGERPRRWRVGLLALAALLVLALAAEALLPAASAVAAEREGERARPRRDRGGVNTEVVGGKPVPQGRFTFMAFVRMGNPEDGFYRCGGSVIDELYVLTAAHCLDDEDGRPFALDEFTIYLGNVAWRNAAPANVRGVAEIYAHPDWNAATNENDVALLKLSAPVSEDVAKPLPFVAAGETQFERAGQLSTVAGWGRTSEDGQSSDRLLAANLHVVADAACAAADSDFVQAVMLCAKYKGRDSCQGDSGGPLFAREVIGHDVKRLKKKKGEKRKKVRIPIYRDIQIGIVSFGRGCADPRYPGIYTRVSAPGINAFIVHVVGSQTPVQEAA